MLIAAVLMRYCHQSPLREYEQLHGLGAFSLSRVFLHDPLHGSYARLERGQIAMSEEFLRQFEDEAKIYGLRYWHRFSVVAWDHMLVRS